MSQLVAEGVGAVDDAQQAELATSPGRERALAGVGRRIVELRAALTQREFAARLGIHKNTLGNYERGSRLPDAHFLLALMASGVRVEWLLSGQGGKLRSDAPSESPSALALDPERLGKVLGLSEEILKEQHVELILEKKAQLIALLYEYGIEAQLMPSKTVALRLLHLAR